MPNDFLSNLSLRAIHETETGPAAGFLQPRLASRFEPAAAPLLPTPEGLGEGETPTETVSPRAAASQPESRLPQPHTLEPRPVRSTEAGPSQPPRHGLEAHETNPFAVQPQYRSAPDAEREQQRVPRPALEAPVSPERGQAAPTPWMESTVRVVPAPAREPAQPLQRSVEEVIRIRQELQPVQPEVRRAPEPAPERVSPPSLKTESVPLPENRVVERIVPERIVITRQEPPPSGPDPSSRLVPASAGQERKTTDDAAQNMAQPPTIHVTIGRIEVKAGQAAPAARSVSSAPVTMSLEEYLRRRQGGSL